MIFLIIGSIFTIIFGTIIINCYMVLSTKSQIIDDNNLDNLKNVDAILVLGCKVSNSKPSEMLKNRLDKAIMVYQKLHTKILLSGDHGKNDYDEVNVMKEYMLKNNVREEDIFQDHAGFSTYDSIYRAKYIFNAQNIVVVTQEYHLPKALYLANAFDIDAVGIKAQDIPYKMIMLKNKIREILSRDKNFFQGIIKPQSKYLGEKISLDGNGVITNG